LKKRSWEFWRKINPMISRASPLRWSLRKHGAGKVFREVASGAKLNRAQRRRVIDPLSDDDVLMVTRLDRLARARPATSRTRSRPAASAGQRTPSGPRCSPDSQRQPGHAVLPSLLRRLSPHPEPRLSSRLPRRSLGCGDME
jgi:hypothetical protein